MTDQELKSELKKMTADRDKWRMTANYVDKAFDRERQHAIDAETKLRNAQYDIARAANSIKEIEMIKNKLRMSRQEIKMLKIEKNALLLMVVSRKKT